VNTENSQTARQNEALTAAPLPKKRIRIIFKKKLKLKC